MILARHVAIIREIHNYHAALRSRKSMYGNERSSHEKMDVAWQCISERLWKCLVGRYGGCFEERYNEAYDDRAYHAKGLDAPAKYAPTLEVSKGNAQYRRGSKSMGRWKCQ